MHKSAMLRMKWFIENYIPKDFEGTVLDIGSYNVNGCYKDLLRGHKIKYVGLDIQKGPNVDVVVKDPYSWAEVEDESIDFVISGNAFEHIEYPWLTINEIYKKLKLNGIICILAPFAHVEHRYPVDCYRYFPDGLIALAKWGGLKVIDATVGGIPKDDDSYKWSSMDENYDDSVLIAIKADSDFDVTKFPKLEKKCLSRFWEKLS